MEKEGERHNPLSPREERPKREVATTLPYVTKRNWSDLLEQRLCEDVPAANASEYRLEEPSFLHVDYAGLLATVFERVDPEGRVWTQNILTGELEMTEPIALHDITPLTSEARDQQRDRLAQRLIEIAENLIRFHDPYAYSPAQVENFTAHLEGNAAQLLAPYRHEPNFLADVSEAANQEPELGMRLAAASEQQP